jgi:threonine/homoserine/homoserine lactone efflux protein
MAWTMARDRSELSVARAAASPSAAKVIVEAILINILNPKLTLFFFAFLPQFVSASVPDALGRMLGLSGVFMLVTLVVFVGYGILAAALRARVIAQPRILVLLRRVFAGSFVVLSARLALTNR